jgi:hypothetical protein
MAKVNVEVGVNNSGFRQGLDGMRAQAKSWATNMTSILGGAFAVGSMVNWFNNFRGEMDRVAKLATRLNESTDSIQRVGQAANLAGADIEMVVKAVSRLTVEASKGSEKFSALGVSAQNFANASLEDKVMMLSQAYQEASGDQQKMIALMDLLGTRAQDLIPLLAQGPDALRDALGGANVVSEQVILSMERLNDNLERVGQWATSAAGAIAGMAQQMFAFVDAISKGKGFSGAMQQIADLDKTAENFAKRQRARAKEMADATETMAAKKKQESDSREAASLADRLEARIEERKLKQMEAQERILTLQQMQFDLQTATMNAALPELERLKAAEKLLDIEQQIADATKQRDAEQARMDADIADAEKRVADAEEKQAFNRMSTEDQAKELQRKKEEAELASQMAANEGDRKTAAEKKLEAIELQESIDRLETDKESEEEKKEELETSKKGIISSSLGEVGGGGGVYVTMDPATRELQTQTGLLRQIANSISPTVTATRAQRPDQAF